MCHIMKYKTRPLSFLIFVSLMLFAETKTSGTVFYNYTRELNSEGFNAFNMKRAYLTLVNDLTEEVSYKVTYDMGDNGDENAHAAFLKVAMVNWTTSVGDVSLGMQGMNMFKTMENTWGHRFISKMPMHKYGFSSSADLGIGLSQVFGAISTSALITNGAGYKKAETDSHKKFSFHAVYGEKELKNQEGFNIGGSLSFEPYDIDEFTVKNITVTGLFSGFSGFGFRGGLELDSKKNSNVMNQIISLYGTYQVVENFSLLARLDKVDINDLVSENVTQEIIVGFRYAVGQGMTVAPTLCRRALKTLESQNSIVVNFKFSF